MAITYAHPTENKSKTYYKYNGCESQRKHNIEIQESIQKIIGPWFNPWKKKEKKKVSQETETMKMLIMIDLGCYRSSFLLSYVTQHIERYQLNRIFVVTGCKVKIWSQGWL